MSGKVTRREFFKLTSAGAAAAVLTGCGPASRYVVRRPYTNMPEYNQTGLSTYYATTCRECPAGCGLIVRTLEGRALLVEGNPNHPVNKGKLCARGITAIQGLYNPDRIKAPVKITSRGNESFTPLDWNAAIKVVSDALKNTPPDQIAFLLGLVPDHLLDLVTELTKTIGAAAPISYHALATFDSRNTLLEATKLAYAKAAFPIFDLGQADVTLCFGANFLETWLSPVSYSKAYGQMRQGRFGKRGYLISFEPRMSLTSGNADEWHPVIPGTEGLVALAIGRLVSQIKGINIPPIFAGVDISVVSKASGLTEADLRHIAALYANAAQPLAIPGGGALGHTNGLENGQAILALNLLVKNTAKPGGVFLSPLPASGGALGEVKKLIQQMNDGNVKVLFIHGVNPIFDLPGSFKFKEALSKVPLVISFATYPDETALQCDYILPDHSNLESFGFSQVLPAGDRPIYSASQPVVAPLFNTRATADVLLAAAQAAGGNLSILRYTDQVEFIQSRLISLVKASDGLYTAPDIETFWTFWLQYGGWWKATPALESPAASGLLEKTLSISAPRAIESGKFFLVPYSTQLGDGNGANRPWLQETPHPMTTAMWNTWVEIHPDTAAKLNIKNDDVVQITSPTGSIEAIAYLYPAIRPDTIAIPFGQGHTALGQFAKGRGSNPMLLIESGLNQAGDLALGDTQVNLAATGKQQKLARQESITGVYGKH